MIERLNATDPRVVAFFAAIFDGATPKMERLRDAWAWGVMDGAEPVAVAVVETDDFHPGGWYLWLFGVSPERRRQGLGTGFLEALEEQARKEGITRLRVRTFARYVGMRALLARAGWWFAAAEPHARQDGVSETWLKPLIAQPFAVALVGANPNGRGGEWAKAVRRMPGLLQLVAVVDTEPAVREYWQEQGLATSASVDALPELGIQAAILALPPRLYGSVRSTCLNRGWGLLHEKPLGADLEELAAFQRELQSRPVPLVAGVQRRNHPSYVALKNFLTTDAIRSVAMSLHLARPPDETPAGHRADLNLAGGGCLLDLGYHAIDLIHFLLERPLDPLAVSLSKCSQPTRRGDREDRAALTGRAGGSWIRLDLQSVAPERVEKVEIAGAEHLWTADRMGVCQDGEQVYQCPRSWADAECGCLAELAGALGRERPEAVDLWDHLAALTVIEHAYSLAPEMGFGRRYG